jgi:hypothetical protein
MSEKSESRRIDGGDPPKSPLKRGTLRVQNIAKLIPKQCLIQLIISLTLDIARSIKR